MKKNPLTPVEKETFARIAELLTAEFKTPAGLISFLGDILHPISKLGEAHLDGHFETITLLNLIALPWIENGEITEQMIDEFLGVHIGVEGLEKSTRGMLQATASEGWEPATATGIIQRISCLSLISEQIQRLALHTTEEDEK